MTMPVAEALASLASTADRAGAPTQVQLGWGASLTDFNAFEQSLQGAVQRIEARPLPPVSPAAQALMRPFDHINGEAVALARDAKAASLAGRELTPGELVQLTVRCQEFMFHCQLTSNIANRTSDGLQQLFRQQS